MKRGDAEAKRRRISDMQEHLKKLEQRCLEKAREVTQLNVQLYAQHHSTV